MDLWIFAGAFSHWRNVSFLSVNFHFWTRWICSFPVFFLPFFEERRKVDSDGGGGEGAGSSGIGPLRPLPAAGLPLTISRSWRFLVMSLIFTRIDRLCFFSRFKWLALMWRNRIIRLFRNFWRIRSGWDIWFEFFSRNIVKILLYFVTEICEIRLLLQRILFDFSGQLIFKNCKDSLGILFWTVHYSLCSEILFHSIRIPWGFFLRTF